MRIIDRMEQLIEVCDSEYYTKVVVSKDLLQELLQLAKLGQKYVSTKSVKRTCSNCTNIEHQVDFLTCNIDGAFITVCTVCDKWTPNQQAELQILRNEVKRLQT